MNQRGAETGSRQRPVGITILAILSAISALFYVIYLIEYAIGFTYISQVFEMSVPLAFLILSLLILIFSIVSLSLVAYGFWKGLRWSWFLAIAFCIIMIIIEISMLVTFLSVNSFIPSHEYINRSFQLIQTLVTIKFVANLTIYGLIIFYLTRPGVKLYFKIGRSENILSTLGNKRGVVAGALAIGLAILIIVIWGFTPKEVNVVSISQIPSEPQPGDKVTIIAEITGGPPFLGPTPKIKYYHIGIWGGGGGSVSMKPIGNNRYSWSTYVDNGTVTWYMIFSNDILLADDIIQVGLSGPDEEILSINDITQVPTQPTSSTKKIEITVEIKNIYNITKIEVPFEYRIGPLSGGKTSTYLTRIDEHHYKVTFTPSTIYGYGIMTEPEQNYNFQKGLKIYYRIIVFDENNNVAISPTQTITIS